MPASSSIWKEHSSPFLSVYHLFFVSLIVLENFPLLLWDSTLVIIWTVCHLFPFLETFADSSRCNPGSALESSAWKSFHCRKLISFLRQLSPEFKSLLFTLWTGPCLGLSDLILVTTRACIRQIVNSYSMIFNSLTQQEAKDSNLALLSVQAKFQMLPEKQTQMHLKYFWYRFTI